ncbi:MAG: acetylglutamate kinase [Prevotella sp.]|nr:acetylglutamate kinase [Candidatus Prevotella equi]
MEKLTIVKVGGAVVEDPQQLAALLDNFSAIEGKKILVHGGGRRATKVAAQLGIESHMVGGRRITDGEMLSVVTMVYGGLVNKSLVAQLQAKGVNALGLTGADMDIIRSHKRPLKKMDVSKEEAESLISNGMAVEKDGNTMVDFGFVGDVDYANGERLAQLLNSGVTPVVAPLTHDGNGNILNTNADTMASTVAKALAEHFDVTLIFSFEKKGVLSNPDDDDSVIPTITRALYNKYVEEGIISGGMMPKIENALEAVEAGVKRVIITLATAIDGNHGTVIKN